MKYLQRLKTGEIYFRKGGRTLGRLPGLEGSPEFMSAYRALLAEHGTPVVLGRPSTTIKPRPEPGKSPSIEHFAELWLASVQFAVSDERKTKETYARGTQQNYRMALKLIDKMGLYKLPLSSLTPHNANLYIQKVKREHGGANAAMQKAVLSNLWRFARGFPEFNVGDRSNPMIGEIAMPYTVEQEHKPWPEDVQDRFLGACSDDVRFAFFLLLCTGQRVSDVVKMRWNQYTEVTDADGIKHAYIELRDGQQKDRSSTPMAIKVPKVLLREIEQRKRVSEFMLTHKWDRPFTRDSLGHRIKYVLQAIGEPEYTTHGLRKNAGIMLAENGATVPQIMAALGHKTPRMALYYCRLANQRLLSEQASAIIDTAFEKRLAARRSAIKRVK